MRARLTRHGWGALAVGAALGVTGPRLGYPAVTAFGAGLAGLVLAALLQLGRLPSLGVRREVTPGAPRRFEECTVTLAVVNRGHRAARLEGVELMNGEELEVSVPYLSAGKAVHVRYPVPTDRRGPLVLGPLRLRRLGLGGLAVGTANLRGRQTVVVAPRVLPTSVPGGLTVIIDNREAAYPRNSSDFDEAVDVASSLCGAATAEPVELRAASGPIDADALATLPLLRGRVRPLATVDPQRRLAVCVTGAAGEPAPLLAALTGVPRAVLLVVDTRPERMVSMVGTALVLRAPRAEELLVAWHEAAAGFGVDSLSGVEVR